MSRVNLVVQTPIAIMAGNLDWHRDSKATPSFLGDSPEWDFVDEDGKETFLSFDPTPGLSLDDIPGLEFFPK